jgi:hypothetical protein
MGMMPLIIHPQYITRPKEIQAGFNSFIKKRRNGHTSRRKGVPGQHVSSAFQNTAPHRH